MESRTLKESHSSDEFELPSKKKCCIRPEDDASMNLPTSSETIPSSMEGNDTTVSSCVARVSPGVVHVVSDSIITSHSNFQPTLTVEHCQFWVERKRRYCKAKAILLRRYCVEHSLQMGEETSRRRVPCPKDPKHSCYADQLKRHLQRCNARDSLLPVCYDEGINSGETDGDDPKLYKVGIRDVDVFEVMEVVTTVQRLHADSMVSIETSDLFHEVLRNETNNPKNGVNAQRHLQQQASLVANMESLGLLKDDCNYVEFGAGKGGLSHWVQLANSSNSNTRYILVDKSAVRYKMDNFHKGEGQGPSFERLKINIEHLNLAKVASISQQQHPLVGMGKHLCGGATDLMLRCLAETADDASNEIEKRVEGLVLALCCHHRCDWRAYVGKAWFKDRGLGPRQFHLISSMSTWATDASAKHTATDSHDVANEDTHRHDNSTYCHPRYGSLSPEQREHIGTQCKQLIDLGRVDYLTQHGFNARLIYYVARTTTLENTAITAIRRTAAPSSESLTQTVVPSSESIAVAPSGESILPIVTPSRESGTV